MIVKRSWLRWFSIRAPIEKMRVSKIGRARMHDRFPAPIKQDSFTGMANQISSFTWFDITQGRFTTLLLTAKSKKQSVDRRTASKAICMQMTKF